MLLSKIEPALRLHLVDNYHRIDTMSRYDLFKAVLMLNCTHLHTEIPDERSELNFMRDLEVIMPAGLRRLYLKELARSADEVSSSNGNYLDPEDYVWCAVNASGVDRAKAYVRTGVLVLIRELRDNGESLPCLDRFEEEFKIAAAEEGVDREGDFNLELWIDSHWQDLFYVIEDYSAA